MPTIELNFLSKSPSLKEVFSSSSTRRIRKCINPRDDLKLIISYHSEIFWKPFCTVLYHSLLLITVKATPLITKCTLNENEDHSGGQDQFLIFNFVLGSGLICTYLLFIYIKIDLNLLNCQTIFWLSMIKSCS